MTVPIDGGDLNPLLQDFGLIIHPPMLYMGYVGLSVVFSFAIACCFENEFKKEWAQWIRPWVLGAWAFLTLGIAIFYASSNVFSLASNSLFIFNL